MVENKKVMIKYERQVEYKTKCPLFYFKGRQKTKTKTNIKSKRVGRGGEIVVVVIVGEWDHSTV